MYLINPEIQSLQRAKAKLGTDQGALEARIIKSNIEHDKYRMLRELEYVITKMNEIDAQIAKEIAAELKPKTFWQKLFQR